MSSPLKSKDSVRFKNWEGPPKIINCERIFSPCNSQALSALLSRTMRLALTSLAEAIDVHVVKHVLKNATESWPRCRAHLHGGLQSESIYVLLLWQNIPSTFQEDFFFQWFSAENKKSTIFWEVWISLSHIFHWTMTASFLHIIEQ